jgi:hypothetical protein
MRSFPNWEQRPVRSRRRGRQDDRGLSTSCLADVSQYHPANRDVILEASNAGAVAASVAVIDGPYDADALSRVLAHPPVGLGNGSCGVTPNSACEHGTFIMGLLGARRDALIPGLCSESRLLHIPLLVDEEVPSASVAALADAITVALAAGAKLINLSLGIEGDDNQNDPALARALDRAEASGAVLVVAAGNQGRLAAGQLLSHSTTVPVVAVDAARRLLPDCNFGPAISRRGIAALGHNVAGYAPGGGMTVMSGTSVATAIATATLAWLWSARPDADGRDVRAALTRLAPRKGPIPPTLDRDSFLAGLDQTGTASLSDQRTHSVRLQGGAIMKEENGLPRSQGRGTGAIAMSGPAVTPANGSWCACGAPGGVCTCADGEPSRFIYVLGSVDIRFPDQSIAEELQVAAHRLAAAPGSTLDPVADPQKPLRDWYYRVLKEDEARYIARQACWILKVEGRPAYYLAMNDPQDLKGLIECLNHPEDDLDLFVGSSSLIPVGKCPGVTVPVLAVDHLRWVKQADLIGWFGTQAKKASKGYEPNPNAPDPTDLFNNLVQSADNFGDTDEWRALNYLAVNYQRLYQRCAEMVHLGYILDSIKVMASRLSRQEKRIVDPVFTFRHWKTGVVHRYFVRVDVTHLFPIIVNELAEYFDR